MLTWARRLLATGFGAMALAAGWNLFDALVHVAVGLVEPPRITGNGAVLVAWALVVVLRRLDGDRRLAGVLTAGSIGVVLGANAAFLVGGTELAAPSLVFIGVSLWLQVMAAIRFFPPVPRDSADDADRDGATTSEVVEAAPDGHRVSRWWAAGGAALLLVGAVASFLPFSSSALLAALHDGRLEDADYWDDELRILSGGLGFEGVIAVAGTDEASVRAAGGSYYADPDCVAGEGPLQTTVVPSAISLAYRGTSTEGADAMPIVFTWPVITTDVHPEDFRLTLTNGDVVTPTAAGMWPNFELGERNTIVLIGEYANRGRADEADALYPVRVEVVDDGTPLMFLGPDGERTGVGLSWETDATPYDSGPVLVGAKLNHVGDEPAGEGGIPGFAQRALPNDEFALYGGGDFRLRMLTSGGFSPDGLLGVRPDQYETFFRIHATGPDGETVLLTETGVDHEVEGGTLRVVGLSDLGPPEGGDVHYDDCYVEDADNYIDIILEGDEAAARSITAVEIPAADPYLPFYNPGGPGPEPFEDVRYTAPGPRDLEPVIIALDDPMRVSTEDPLERFRR